MVNMSMTLRKTLPLVSFSLMRCFATSATRNIRSSVDPKEMEFFRQHAKTWWDKNTGIQTLINLNPVRMEIFQQYLIEGGLILEKQAMTSKPLENLNILDVGCGGGYMTEAMAKLGGKVTGIDANVDLIDVANEHMLLTPPLKDNLNYINVTVEEFAVENKDKFDVVIASEVIEHVLDKEMFAENTLKCLRPGGSAIFTTMNRNWISGFYYIFLCENILNSIVKGAHEYDKFMKPKEMADLFRKYNCEKTSVDGFTLNPFNRKWFRVGFLHLNYAMHAVKQHNFD